jgi:hypothetical protein
MTDYKQLCADLVAAWDDLPWHYDWKGNLIGLADGCQFDDSAVERARAALAEPEPKGPTDEEIEEWADACPEAPLEELDPEVYGWRRCFTAHEFSETIRAAIARWGNHPGSPDSSTLQPAPVSERLPEPTDEPMIPDHYRGDDIRVYREGFHAGYKYAFQLIEKHSDV